MNFKAHGVGRLTRDPELRYTQSGKAVCDFGMAFNEVRKTKDGGRDETAHFFDFVIWDTGAETLAKYCEKGSELFVEASAKQDRWETSEGQKRSKVVFRVDQFQFVGSRNSNSTTSKSADSATAPTEDEGVPF